MNVTDLLSAQVEAQLMVAEWEREFMEQFFGPVLMAQRVQALLAGDPDSGAGAPEIERATALAQIVRRDNVQPPAFG